MLIGLGLCGIPIVGPLVGGVMGAQLQRSWILQARPRVRHGGITEISPGYRACGAEMAVTRATFKRLELPQPVQQWVPTDAGLVHHSKSVISIRKDSN